MAKKRGFLAHAAGTIRDELAEPIMNSAARKIRAEQKNISRMLIYSLLLSAGVIFTGIAAVILAEKYLSINYGWDFLFIGIVLLIISTSIRRQTEI